MQLLTYIQTIKKFIDAHLYLIACIVFMIFGYGKIIVALIMAFPNGGLVMPDAPFGGDYTSFYAASKIILAGNPDLVYDETTHKLAQVNLFGEKISYFAYFYPPIYMIYCLPMAFLSYIYSVVLWILSTFIFCFFILKIYARNKIYNLQIFGFGGTQFNILVGQNAFLSTGLMGGGLIFLKKRPLLAGIFFGLLTFKPHLGIIIPFFLVSAGQWRAIISACVTFVALVLVSIALFGVKTWIAFFHHTSSAVYALENSTVGDAKMHSFFGAIRLFGGSLHFAYSIQILCALCVILVVMRNAYLLRHSLNEMIPLVAVSALMISPFILAYDMMLLAIPLIFLFQEGQKSGFLRGEREGMLIAFVTPIVANTVAVNYNIPFVPFLTLYIFALVLRRIRLRMQELRHEPPTK